MEIFELEFIKIAQIEVFGHFLNFASLVFLDFAHNDRWALYPVVFLQFAGPVNVFLLRFKIKQEDIIKDMTSQVSCKSFMQKFNGKGLGNV